MALRYETMDATDDDDLDDDEGDPSFWPPPAASPQGPAADADHAGPSFDPVYPMNLSVMAGQPVELACRVRNIADRVVSVAHCNLPNIALKCNLT